MGLGALGIGFWMQGLVPGPTDLNGPMLQAMLEAPPPSPRGLNGAADQLRDLKAERARDRSRGFDLSEPAPGRPLHLEIRVALERATSEVRLSATGPWWLRAADGRVIRQGAAGQSIELAAGPLDAPELWLESQAGSVVSFDGRGYEGRLRLVRQPGGWLVVNHLPLEAYVASVVGAEMPSSWDPEALKAQAVAARSYALAHMARPANRHWHLGATTRWQAYRGVDSLSPRVRQAARATDGLILSYQGGIVESLYAANSQISWEAHGQLGASMSQQGAQALATRGLRYGQILARYYPGASLARLRQGKA